MNPSHVLADFLAARLKPIAVSCFPHLLFSHVVCGNVPGLLLRHVLCEVLEQCLDSGSMCGLRRPEHRLQHLPTRTYCHSTRTVQACNGWELSGGQSPAHAATSTVVAETCSFMQMAEFSRATRSWRFLTAAGEFGLPQMLELEHGNLRP